MSWDYFLVSYFGFLTVRGYLSPDHEPDTAQKEESEMGKRATTNQTGTPIITITKAKHGAWRSASPFFNAVAMHPGPIPFDIFVMNMFDRLCGPGHGATIWDMALTSNGSFFIYPANVDSDRSKVTVTSPNGHRASLDRKTAALVSTMFALSWLSFTPTAAHVPAFSNAYDRLEQYALTLPDASKIRSLID